MKTLCSIVFLFISSIALSSCRQDPVITESPTDVTVRQGNDVTLRCVVEHLPSNDLTPVQWTRGGFALGYDRNLSNWRRYTMVGDVSIGEYHLRIENVNVNEDEEIYECQVTTNRLRSQKAKLTVQVPPTGPEVDDFDAESGKVRVVVGKANDIVCRSYLGKPPASLQWYRNGIVVSEGVSAVVTDVDGKLYNTTTTMQITPTQADAGVTYACVMTSDALDSTEIGRKLLQLNMIKPPQITAVILPSLIREGTYVNAECEASSDLPVLSYRWFVNGEPQAEEQASSFGLGTVDRTMHGTTISCEASNEGGASKLKNVTMEVLYPPVFVNGSGNISAEIGDNITLWCEWESNPKAVIYWMHDGKDIPEEHGTKLELTKVTQGKGGDYVCRANAADIGENSKLSRVNIRGPPLFTSTEAQYTKVGEDSLLTCSLSSYPGIEQVNWTWVHDGVTFMLSGNESVTAVGDVIVNDVHGAFKYGGVFTPGSSVAYLKVIGVTADDLHSYTCSVSNSYGINSFTAALKEDEGNTQSFLMLGITIGGAVGGVVLIVVVILLIVCCVRCKRRKKTTNFKKEQQSKSKSSEKRLYSEDETIPINHLEVQNGENNYKTSSISSHNAVPSLSVTGSDVTNPTPASGHDDGYHTEEANSWNREHGKVSLGSTSPAKNSTVNTYPGYARSLTPAMEVQETQPSAYMDDLDQHYGNPYSDSVTRPLSPARYGYDQPMYDPTSFTNPVSAVRSVSALGERLSPPPVRYVNRNYSDLGTLPNMYSNAPPVDYYPSNPRPYTPLHTLPQPPAPYAAQHYNPEGSFPPHQMGGGGYYPMPVGSSQSSLDKFERGSALSGSAVAARLIDPYENPPRMSNMSRASASSRSVDLSRPMTARMATHV